MKYDLISAHLKNTQIPRTNFNINPLINIYLISVRLISTQVMNTHRRAGWSMHGCGCGFVRCMLWVSLLTPTSIHTHTLLLN